MHKNENRILESWNRTGVITANYIVQVRHSVFIIGNAGTGKSQVWRTLNKTYQMQKTKPVAQDLNPKAVTNDELFGRHPH